MSAILLKFVNMLFNSFDFFLFLIVVLIIYYFTPGRYRWVILLISSIFFYLFTDIKTFIVPVIIVFNTFICGKMISSFTGASKKKLFFLTGFFINLGLLVFFKYVNFILEVFTGSLNIAGNLFLSKNLITDSPIVIQLVVPLGISFITFQAIGYLLEIYRSNANPEKNIGIFSTYLLFFPKLLSGPIERSNNFIPQLYRKNEFNYDLIIEGLKRIVLGLFLKLVVADRLEVYTSTILEYYQSNSGLTLLVASGFFTIQLFADFAGYTDIAIGTALLFGYRLTENFNAPFKSKSITEFWSRWHISLSNWLRDYVFLPVSYSVARKYMKKKNKVFKTEYISYITAVLITMTICGIWHGASWNFLIFGFLQGFIMTFELLTKKIRKKVKKNIPDWLDTSTGIIFTFCFFSFTTIFFRAHTLGEAFYIINKIFTSPGSLYFVEWQQFSYCVISIALLVLIYFVQKVSEKYAVYFKSWYWLVQQVGYAVLIILILLIGVFDGGQFIYFKF